MNDIKTQIPKDVRSRNKIIKFLIGIIMGSIKQSSQHEQHRLSHTKLQHKRPIKVHASEKLRKKLLISTIWRSVDTAVAPATKERSEAHTGKPF